ncbi:MAG: RNA polymerase sigma factor RpoD/SigA [Flavobacteriales bacterium]
MRQLKITRQLTNRSTKAIEKYLSDGSRENMITAEEEVNLAVRIKKGDTAALNKLVNANLRFVISVAKQYQGHGLTLEDLIAEGNIGLITAAKRFDETKGFKFISYAVWWIRQSIIQAIAENSRVVRLPLNKVSAIQKVAKAYSKLEQKFERAPTDDEISELMETNGETVTNLNRHSQRQISIDAPLGDSEDDHNLLNLLENENTQMPSNGLIRESLRQDIDRLLECLCRRDAEVIRLSFGLNGQPPMTLDEIAGQMDLTRERIRQIREKALKILRHNRSSINLKHYM